MTTNSEPRELAKDIPVHFHVMQKVVDVMTNYNLKAHSATKIELEICPSCEHDDYRAGFLFYPDGLQLSIFIPGCEYNKSAVWKKDGFVGPRLKELYRLMGGDPQNLDPASRYIDSYRETIDMVKNASKYFNRHLLDATAYRSVLGYSRGLTNRIHRKERRWQNQRLFSFILVAT